jgi:hypothetical protein
LNQKFEDLKSTNNSQIKSYTKFIENKKFFR